MQHGGSVWALGAHLLDRGGAGRLPQGTPAPLFVPDKEPGPVSGVGPPGPPAPRKQFLVWQHCGEHGRGGNVRHAGCEHQQLLEHGAAAGAGGHGRGGGFTGVGDPGRRNRQPTGQGDARPRVGGQHRGILRGERDPCVLQGKSAEVFPGSPCLCFPLGGVSRGKHRESGDRLHRAERTLAGSSQEPGGTGERAGRWISETEQGRARERGRGRHYGGHHAGLHGALPCGGVRNGQMPDHSAARQERRLICWLCL